MQRPATDVGLICWSGGWVSGTDPDFPEGSRLTRLKVPVLSLVAQRGDELRRCEWPYDPHERVKRARVVNKRIWVRHRFRVRRWHQTGEVDYLLVRFPTVLAKGPVVLRDGPETALWDTSDPAPVGS